MVVAAAVAVVAAAVVAVYNLLVPAAVVVVAAAVVVVAAGFVVAATAAFGHVVGLLAEVFPQYPPYSSLTAALGLPSPDERTQATSNTKALLAQAVTPAVLNL